MRLFMRRGLIIRCWRRVTVDVTEVIGYRIVSEKSMP
jgi:hypothetical protein